MCLNSSHRDAPDFFSSGCSRMVCTAGASEKELRLMVLKHMVSGFMACSLLRMSAVLPVPAQQEASAHMICHCS